MDFEGIQMRSDTSCHLQGGRRRGDVHTERPLLSIVIVVFKADSELQNILSSIFEFDPGKFEVIVIDGGSHDGTVDVLRKWNERIDYWVSEPDQGIYDAMNKGIAVARGEYILHLNAGDRLKFIPYETLAACLAEGVDVASFPVLQDDGVFHPTNGFLLRLTNTWHHQGTFYRRTEGLKYDTRYRVFGDFNLNQRMLKSGKKVRLFERVVSAHQNDGVSNSRVSLPELYRSVRENFGPHYILLSFLLFKYKGMRQRARRLIAYVSSRVGTS
jgi:glycosyltransferase involved in cell wall biosynthesis